MASARYIARMPEARRLAVLTAFVKAQEIPPPWMKLLMCLIC
jgi:hypothetical protein